MPSRLAWDAPKMRRSCALESWRNRLQLRSQQRDITVQDGIQLFQSGESTGDIEHRQDVSIGRNRHFVPGPKDPFTIHLGFGLIII